MTKTISPKYKLHGSGPLLVYVPGLDGTGELIFKQADELSRHYRLASFRLRDEPDITYEDLTADIAAIIRDQHEKSATILAESFGGTIALTFALHYPDMVDRLVIVNSFPRFRGRLRIRLAARLAAIVPFRLTSVVRRAACIIGLHLDGVGRTDRLFVYRALDSVNKAAFARRLRLIAEVNLEALLDRIAAPCLFIAGDRDLLIPSVKEAERMASLILKSSVRVIHGAGHACLLGNRVSLVDLVADWANSTAGY